MFYEDSFLAYLAFERRLSTHTQAAYRSDLQHFTIYLQEHAGLTSIHEVRPAHIRRWIVLQMQAGISSRSINRRISCLKTYTRFLKKQGRLSEDLFRKIVTPKSGRRLPVFVPEVQLEQLFQEVDFGVGYQAELHRTALELLYGAGLRRSEAVGLQLTDVDLSRGLLRILGKGGKDRMTPFTPHLANVLKKFLELRSTAFPDTTEKTLLLHPNGKPLSVYNLYYLVHKYLSAITSVEQRSPHVLRHSYATHLSNRGADLNAIKSLLGHANLAATQVYMHNSIERLLEVYRQAHPKGGGEAGEQEQP